MEKLAGFLAGDRLDDVAIYVDEQYLGESQSLAEAGETVESGVVLVIPGDTGRSAFESATGLGAMEFAKKAMGREGHIEPDLAGGVCPDDDDDGEHTVEFVFSFAEAQNEEVGGMYEEGDVIHAYAHCSCGVDFSQKWLVDSRK